MKKKLFRTVMTIIMTVLILSLAVTMGVFYNYFNKTQTEQLKNELYNASVIMDKYGEDYIHMLNNSTYRFTLISDDGSVRYDTKADYGKMENHLNREEIAEALAMGKGNSTRYSSTLTEKTIYTSIKLDDGNVLRASISQKTITALILSILPYIVGVILLGAVIAFILAKHMAKHITEPLNMLDLDNPAENNTYEELSPILSKLNKQHHQIKSQMETLQQRQDEFDQIISSMSEGLILLDEHGIVLSMNTAAKKVFSIKNAVIGSDFLTIDRSLDVSKAVNEALEGKHSEFRMQKNGNEYQLNISPIESGTRKLGAIILAFDITDKAFAERNRQEFTANVTHELKTPLQSILGSAELLENGLVKPEDTNKFIHKINKEANRLINLINDILCLSQLEENVEPVLETVNLNEVINEVIDVLSASAAKRNVTMEVTGEALSMKGIRRYLYEIIYNLCDNAIRYNTEGGKVMIHTYKEENHTIIAVSDTGIGISPEHHARIFERFYRVDKSHSRETDGTGLGLSIVKHAVQLLNGRVEMESQIGEGTTVKAIFD